VCVVRVRPGGEWSRAGVPGAGCRAELRGRGTRPPQKRVPAMAWPMRRARRQAVRTGNHVRRGSCRRSNGGVERWKRTFCPRPRMRRSGRSPCLPTMRDLQPARGKLIKSVGPRTWPPAADGPAARGVDCPTRLSGAARLGAPPGEAGRAAFEPEMPGARSARGRRGVGQPGGCAGWASRSAASRPPRPASGRVPRAARRAGRGVVEAVVDALHFLAVKEAGFESPPLHHLPQPLKGILSPQAPSTVSLCPRPRSTPGAPPSAAASGFRRSAAGSRPAGCSSGDPSVTVLR
jgi:hypothetical protein